MDSSFLEVDGLVMRFGGLTAVNSLTFSVDERMIHGLIGPNGAGKTTTFNAISGFLVPTGGEVRFRGETISGLPMHRVARKGVVRTFQHSTLFAELSVMENAMVGTHMCSPPSLWAAVSGMGRGSEGFAADRAREALEFFGLTEFSDQPAGSLPHGHQRAIGMAVALAAEPKLLLLDEPFTGMNPEETERMMQLMFKLRDSGVTILIVEHDMRAIMGLCDRITVMNFGKLLTEGHPDDIRSHPEVVAAYLGSAYSAA